MLRPIATRLLPLALVGLLGACGDTGTSPQPRDKPALPSAGGTRIAELTCRVDVRARDVSCANASPPAGSASADIIVGGQNVYVRLASTSTGVTDVRDPAERDTFAFDATVQNLIPQTLGTTDGASADLTGVRVFFVGEPATTGGSGRAYVANPDGRDVFTGVDQPYFQYAGLLAQNATSAARRWKLAFDPSVETFAFKVYVSAVVQYPTGWVDVSSGTLGASLARGATGQPVAGVRNQVGDAMDDEAVAWSASTAAVKVNGTGSVSAECGGSAVVTASTATRPARLGVLVSVPAPVFSSFSPEPYSAGASTVSRAADLTASFGYCTVAAGPATFVVHGSQGSPSLLGGTYAGAGTGTATFSHTGAFFPGEEVEATLTSGLVSQGRVVRFRTAAGAASGSFPGPVLATGSKPRFVAVGDLNGDGRPDLAVANYDSASVSVLMRNAADNGYDAQVNHITGFNPTSIAVADLNGDGRLDLAVANEGSNTVSVLLRNVANTGYAVKADYLTGASPSSVAVGDFNGDGRLDLAVANSDLSANTVSVLLRNAANTGFDA
ncbi:MAG TPA: VCBS repeat-containing protein, partial [Longimicrobiaceae bacterium]|nr:VCBS repeat-containing protein [Longimicrobiaceae bacterium]